MRHSHGHSMPALLSRCVPICCSAGAVAATMLLPLNGPILLFTAAAVPSPCWPTTWTCTALAAWPGEERCWQAQGNLVCGAAPLPAALGDPPPPPSPPRQPPAFGCLDNPRVPCAAAAGGRCTSALWLSCPRQTTARPLRPGWRPSRGSRSTWCRWAACVGGVGSRRVGEWRAGGMRTRSQGGRGGLRQPHTRWRYVLCLPICPPFTAALAPACPCPPLSAPACSMRTSPPGRLATRFCTTSRGRHAVASVFLCHALAMWECAFLEGDGKERKSFAASMQQHVLAAAPGS